MYSCPSDSEINNIIDTINFLYKNVKIIKKDLKDQKQSNFNLIESERLYLKKLVKQSYKQICNLYNRLFQLIDTDYYINNSYNFTKNHSLLKELSFYSKK